MQVKTKIFTTILSSYDDNIKLADTVNDFIADKDFVSIDFNMMSISSPMDCIRYTAFITYQESR
ncbi:hypothetical protein ACG3JJ_02340 [Streptococcus parauberis]|uniref:hypothetical protein n=1 Tax=Streptococcus parauberis TaxID=1348 RepID=UPI00044F9343|nr:hypothetical protein [Streptococcus parauberis]QBX09808.1 hypothetical protein JavanS388_0019 [Streptococcus satellite phage Javan388]RLU30199.1 hypothetical protein DIY21_09405 [Streptococcus iniae]RLU35553.1 hypothetical protein DIY19_09525 [Streptococcus iniae]RLU36200.1 hypothetical protein DIY20_09415 [Streptococcus iniae]UWM91118.1 hypothetical protein N2A94_00395 [Streptococcus parauberis]